MVAATIDELLTDKIFPYLYGRNVDVHGYVDPRFYSLKQAFRKNFLDGYERDGATVAVYHRGTQVANLWAGHADTSKNKFWKQNTRTLLFSATKALSGLCLAKLVDKGLIRWDDKVALHWLNYGQNGKENTTIEHILAHQAGLPYLKEDITYKDALETDRVIDMLALSAPLWIPGTASGYHAMTFGWLVDGIIRKVDLLHRDLSTFFHEEIAVPWKLDVSIGLRSDSEFSRTAVMTMPKKRDFLRDTLMDPRMLVMIAGYYSQTSDSALGRMEKNQKWFDMENADFNKIEVQRLKLGAANGIGTADDVARLFSVFLNGSIVDKSVVEKMSKPTLETWHWEQTVLYPLMKGHGFFYDYHPHISGKYVYGHPGFGCQSIHIDAENDLVVVYLSNGLKSTTSHLCRPYQRLLNNVYRVV